jgi:hypothetical protein
VEGSGRDLVLETVLTYPEGLRESKIVCWSRYQSDERGVLFTRPRPSDRNDDRTEV